MNFFSFDLPWYCPEPATERVVFEVPTDGNFLLFTGRIARSLQQRLIFLNSFMKVVYIGFIIIVL